MKASVKQYAESLFELVSDQSEAETKSLIAKFVAFLYRRQELNRAEAIIEELNQIYDEASGEASAELVSARSLSAPAKQKIAAYLERRAGISKVKLNEKLDPELLGGFVLHYKGLVIDGSLKNNLSKFKKQLSN